MDLWGIIGWYIMVYHIPKMSLVTNAMVFKIDNSIDSN